MTMCGGSWGPGSGGACDDAGRWVADHRHAGRRDDCWLSGEQGTASVGRLTWAQTCARVWVSAWLELRLRTRWAAEATAWWSALDVAEDEYWHCEVRYEGSSAAAVPPNVGER